MNDLLSVEVERAVQEYEKFARYPATRTRAMIARHGYVEALTRLMLSPDIQKGFTALVIAGRLDLTFESIVCRHPQSFKRTVVEAASWRLSQAASGPRDS
jgi:hypothetical protein